MKGIKKMISFLLAVVMVISILQIGTIQNVNAATAKKLKTGVKVTKVSVTASSIRVKVKITNGRNKDLWYGENFYIQRLENGKWKDVEMKESIAFPAIAYAIHGKGNVYKTYSLSGIYDKKELTPGKYRIYVSVILKESKRFAEFTIPEFQSVDLKENTKLSVKKRTVIKLKPNTDREIQWTSSDEKIATVNNKGLVTIKKKGKVKIKAKYGNKVLKCTIKVE